MAALSRRTFLHRGLVTGGALAVGPAVLDLAGCTTRPPAGGGTTTTAPTTAPPTTGPGVTVPGSGAPLGRSDVVFSLSPTASGSSGEAAVRDALGRFDWSWLGRGDTVLVKLASNSGKAHPMTTSPVAVRAVVAELQARGAGRVVVADQSGVEFVRQHADGTRSTSGTRDLTRQNGLLAAIEASGAEPHFFEEHDYTSGFFAAAPPAGSRWNGPLMLPAIVREADHIVYLPRLASHIIAGYTAAHKMAIGWLRDDSRGTLHRNGPAFYENYVDISYTQEIRSRFRLAVLYAEKALLHNGPDNGTVASVDPRLVLASSDLAALDAVITGLLLHLNESTAATGGRYARGSANLVNSSFVNAISANKGWGTGAYQALDPHRFEDGILSDRALARAWQVAGRPTQVRVVRHGTPPEATVQDAVTHHGQGVLTFV